MKFGTLVRIKSPSECEEKFRRLQSLGLESCQLVYKPERYSVEDALEIKAAADSLDIEISAFFAGFRDNYTKWELKYDFLNAGLNSHMFGAQRLAYVISAFPFVAALGVQDVIVHAGFIPNNPFAPEYADMLAQIKLLAEEAKRFGINILFETGAESPITLLRTILEVGTGNLFVNLDTGNIIMYGYGNPSEAVMTLGKYVRNVHAKDGMPPTDPYTIGKEMPIGEGVVDFSRVLRLLSDIGYDRFITIEREIEGEEQIRDIENGFRYIEKILENSRR